MRDPSRMQLCGIHRCYIRQHYDPDVLKCVYINSDGGSWIRAAANYVGKSRLVADRFHLMKYINRAARYTQEEETVQKGGFINIYTRTNFWQQRNF